ncbi:MAG: polysaccharide deacetylase family protein [Acidobacteriota bacterium]
MTRSDRARPGFWQHSPLIRASAGLHGAALIALAAAPESWPLALGSIVASHAAIAAASMAPRSSLLGPNITRLPAPPPGGLSLTFDDGPDPDVTPRVLDLLAQAGAVATFFCIGRQAEQHPDLIAAIRAAGHGVENHTYAHDPRFALGRSAALRAEVGRAQVALTTSGAAPPRFFRAPAGMVNPWLAAVLAAEALSLVSWTRRGFDTVTRDPAVVAARLVKNLGAGDILVLHDGRSARTATGAPVVLDALARVLERMARQSLSSAALGALLPPSPAEPQGS